jgi:hydroxymethylpyrimidine/phosphomethylpyrimidine kinase
VRKAQAYLNLCLRAGYAPGKGYGPPRHDAPLVRERARAGVLRALDEAVDVLQTTPGMHRLVPEVRLNLALALPWPMGLDDVAAYTGRVTRTRAGRVMACGCPAFGASSHMAKVVLAARRFNPEIACAASIACNPDVERAVREAGLTAARFDRADEPADVREREGSSLEWGTMDALARAEDPRAVDAVADRGGDGKEPIIRILGRDVPEVLGKLTAIIDRL